MNRWKRVASSLARLAEDQRGNPEGDVARQKLTQILAKYPAARSQPDVVAFMRIEIASREAPMHRMTMAEYFAMRRAGVDTDGSWTGRDFDDAVRKMEEELRQRMSDVMQEAIKRAMEEHRRRVEVHFSRIFMTNVDQTTTGTMSSGWAYVRPERHEKPE